MKEGCLTSSFRARFKTSDVIYYDMGLDSGLANAPSRNDVMRNQQPATLTTGACAGLARIPIDRACHGIGRIAAR